MREIPNIADIARAWFPRPEFLTFTEYRTQNLATLLRVQHCGTNFYIDHIFDETYFDLRDSEKLITTIIRDIAHRMHFELALKGIGVERVIGGFYDGFYDVSGYPWARHDGVDEWGPKKALLQLCQFQLIEREAQGLGQLVYLVRPGKSAHKISKESLDKPLEWWQGFISKIIAEETPS